MKKKFRNVLLALALAHMGACATSAHAAGRQLDSQGCEAVAEFAESAGELRDMGADLDKFLAHFRAKNPGVPMELVDLLSRKARRSFTSSLPSADLAADFIKRCAAVKGDMGLDI